MKSRLISTLFGSRGFGWIAIAVVIACAAGSYFTLTSLSEYSDSEIFSSTTEPVPSYLAALRVDDHEMEDADRPARFRSAEAKQLSAAIPAGAFLRDYEKLKGTEAYLVLYVLNASVDTKESIMDFNGEEYYPMWCGAMDFGQAMYGEYSLALVRDAKIVNEVGVPFRNAKEDTWKSSSSLGFRFARCMIDSAWNDKACIDDGIDFLETRLLNSTDLTGDGWPYEVLFRTEYFSCGNDFYAIAAYDKSIDRVVWLPFMFLDGTTTLSLTNFFPKSDGTYEGDTDCDHGKPTHSIVKYSYDPVRKVYALNSVSPAVSCDLEPKAETVEELFEILWGGGTPYFPVPYFQCLESYGEEERADFFTELNASVRTFQNTHKDLLIAKFANERYSKLQEEGCKQASIYTRDEFLRSYTNGHDPLLPGITPPSEYLKQP